MHYIMYNVYALLFPKTDLMISVFYIGIDLQKVEFRQRFHQKPKRSRVLLVQKKFPERIRKVIKRFMEKCSQYGD